MTTVTLLALATFPLAQAGEGTDDGVGSLGAIGGLVIVALGILFALSRARRK